MKALAFLGQNKGIDLIFLDIEMPGMTGLEFLSSMEHKAAVILISSKEEYALASYDFDIVDYLKKPIAFSRLMSALKKYEKKVLTSVSEFNSGATLYVKTNSLLEKINTNDIYCVRAADDYIDIIFSNSKMLVHSTLGEFLKKLPSSDFMQVHRSSVVNLNKIDKVDQNTIELGKELVTVSKTYKSRLLERLNIL